MNLRDFCKNTGIKITFIGKKIGVARSTLYQVIDDEVVSYEVAELIEQFTKGMVTPKRSKTVFHKKVNKKKSPDLHQDPT